jgi:histidinol dehydrogenase
MIRIVSSSNKIAVSQLLAAERVRDRSTVLGAEQIVNRVRRGGDVALKRYARAFDGLTGAIEVPRRVWEKQAAMLSRDVRTAIARAARHIRSVSRKQVPKGWRHTVAAGITVEQRVTARARVGCYVPAAGAIHCPRRC